MASRPGLQSGSAPRRRATSSRAPRSLETETPVLDLVYLASTLALFALVALVVKGAERL